MDFAATAAAASELAYKATTTEGGSGDSGFLKPLISVRKLIVTVSKAIWQETRERLRRLVSTFWLPARRRRLAGAG